MEFWKKNYFKSLNEIAH